MKLSQKKILIVILVSAIMGVCLGRIIIIRMNNYLDDLDSQITDKRTEHNKATDEIQANTEFVKNWGQIEGLLEEPTEERQTRLNTYIQKLESESKVQITNYGTFSEKPVEGHLKFRLLSLDKLRFSCNLESLVEILTRLDTDDQRLLRITQIRINVAASSPSVVAAARLEPEIPGVAPMDLTVEMAISIPIAVPDESAVDGREN